MNVLLNVTVFVMPQRFLGSVGGVVDSYRFEEIHYFHLQDIIRNSHTCLPQVNIADIFCVVRSCILHLAIWFVNISFFGKNLLQQFFSYTLKLEATSLPETLLPMPYYTV